MFQPMHGLVTVVLDPRKTKTDGGIELPDTMQATTIIGTVRGVGPAAFTGDRNSDPVTLMTGDRVVIGVSKGRDGRAVNFGTITDTDGVEVALVNFSDIWGILPEQGE